MSDNWAPNNKNNIARWLKDMNFMFWWHCSFHSNIKFVSSRQRLISSIYFAYFGIHFINVCFQVCGYHIGCDFSPDGRIVSSGSADGKIFFYDHLTSRVIRTLDAHSAPCMDVAYHPTLPCCVASCGWNGQVKVGT